MQLIVNGFAAEAVGGLVKSLLQSPGVEHIFWIRDNLGEGHQASHGELTVIDHQAALSLDHSALPANATVPVWTDAILSLYTGLKPVVLKMLDRLDRYGPAVDYPQREVIFRSQFTYWHAFLCSRQISAFVTSNIPHEITDFIIAELCKALGIAHLCFYQWTPDVVLPLHDYQAMGDPIAGPRAPLAGAEREIVAQVRQRVISEQATPEAGRPFYMVRTNIKRQQRKREQHWLERVKRKLKSDPRRLFSRSGLRYARYVTVDKRLLLPGQDAEQQRAYAAIATTDVAYDKPYIYLALHYQPEATTSPLGGPYVDQYLIVEVLLAAFPPEVHVYVKEHPNQRSIGRGKDYYTLFPSSPRVVFIAPEIDSGTLQESALAVATVSGTVGFESIWKSKPVLLFGYTYYAAGPEVYRIHTIADARAAAASILARETNTSGEAAQVFTEQLFERLLPANIDTYYHDNSVEGLSAEHNVRVLSREILARIAPASSPQ